jgi:predicted RNase H-like HicB family nuclease
MRDYHINIFYSEDDECYVADIPDLQYCSAFGDTPEEAAKEIMIAKELWLEVAAESGKEIPKPTYSPIIYKFNRNASV